MRCHPMALLTLAGAWVISAVAATPVRAEDMWVKKAAVKVRAGKGSIHKVVATLGKGDRLTVVERDMADPKWLKVSAGGKTGWVYEDALNKKPVDRKTGMELADASSSG